jgi:hypothetical protein
MIETRDSSVDSRAKRNEAITVEVLLLVELPRALLCRHVPLAGSDSRCRIDTSEPTVSLCDEAAELGRSDRFERRDREDG